MEEVQNNSDSNIRNSEELTHLTSKSIKDIDESIEEENLKKLEAALFIAGRYMNIQELVSLTDINPLLLRKLIRDLEDKYKDFGINIVQSGDKWKMDVSEEYTYLVNRLASGQSEFSKAEQETLAVIAYKQPMKQSVLVKIRGNKAYDHIKKFSEMSLISKKKQGHTCELSLSDKFYDYFHINKGEEF